MEPTAVPRTREQLEGTILELLAADQEKSVPTLREELQARGEDLPVDSLLLAELLTSLEELCGVRLPDDVATARDLRSVSSLAQRLSTEIERARSSRATG